jgi:hypothetical protein
MPYKTLTVAQGIFVLHLAILPNCHENLLNYPFGATHCQSDSYDASIKKLN